MKKDKIADEINEWIKNNKEVLPVNIDYWEVFISEKKTVEINAREISFGKYNSTDLGTNRFYKSISRVIKIK